MNVSSSRTGLFALSQNILKNLFKENYLNLIILKYQHSASKFAEQQNKDEAYIQNLAKSESTNKQNRIKLLTNKQNRIKLLSNKQNRILAIILTNGTILSFYRHNTYKHI